jgi:hypothetical protein
MIINIWTKFIKYFVCGGNTLTGNGEQLMEPDSKGINLRGKEHIFIG